MNEVVKFFPTAGQQIKTLHDGGVLDMSRDHVVPVLDTMQRPLRDLRISVTDRCNLRCTYCMPRAVFDDQYDFLPRSELLSFEEIIRLVKLAIPLGVQKIRLTGGEPLLRRGIERLIEALAGLRTFDNKPLEVALTTNAVLLAKKAQVLKEAGLTRISVSLDGLDEATFQRMSDSEVSVSTVLEGIAAAQRAELAPVKVNMVVQRGVNEHQILPMVEHFRHSGVILRFIEYMDVGSSNGWRLDDVVTAQEILSQIAAQYPIHQVGENYSGEVAARWQYADGAGEIGVIASVTQVFCQSCTRARLSTDGKLYTCLFATDGVDLRAPLRLGVADQVLTNLIAEKWGQRNDRYSALRQASNTAEATGNRRHKIEMSYIGG